MDIEIEVVDMMSVIEEEFFFVVDKWLLFLYLEVVFDYEEEEGIREKKVEIFVEEVEKKFLLFSMEEVK